METSAPDLERRTFVPWWAGHLAAALVILTGLLCFATAACISSLCIIVAVTAVLGEVGRPWLDDAMVSVIAVTGVLLLSIGLTSLCASGANWLGNSTRWRSRAVRSHRCPWCRYDIRGLPEQRCPECGETW